MTMLRITSARLLSEIIKKVYPFRGKDLENCCRELSLQLQISEEDYKKWGMNVGLEFHHDGSNLIDISFIGGHWGELTPKSILPEWWREYVVNCVDILPELVGNGFAPNELKKFDNLSEDITLEKNEDIVLTNHHIFECEKRNGRVVMAGFFQHICLDKESARSQKFYINRALKKIIALTGDLHRFKNHYSVGTLDSIEVILGAPKFIGVMTGRRELYKIIFQECKAVLNTEAMAKSNLFPSIDNSEAERIQKIADGLALLEGCSSRICIDICTHAMQVAERFCFEIFPEKPLDKTGNCKLLNKLQLLCQISQAIVDDIKMTHVRLPFGWQPNPATSSLFKLFEGTSEDWNGLVATKAAVFSHFKLCLIPQRPATLKTYVYIRQKPTEI